MHIVMLTSPHTACGIATYTENLSRALREAGMDVRVTRAISELDSLLDRRVDILHIQHEFALFPDESRLFEALVAAQRRCVPTVVTTHTETRDAILRFADKANAVIVHHDLFELGRMHRSVVRIPHGVLVPRDLPLPAACREKFGIRRDAFVIGTTGFWARSRPIRVVIEDLAMFFRKQTDSFLHLVTSAHFDDRGGEKAKRLRREILQLAETHGFSDRVWVGDSFIEGQEYHERIHSFDLGFAMANPDWQSSSGSVTAMLGCGVPVVANDVSHFRAVRSACQLVPTVGDIGPAIIELHRRWDEVSAALRARVATVREELGYPHVARAHHEVYARLIA